MQTKASNRPLAEEIWHFHWSWLIKQGVDAKTIVEDQNIMDVALVDAGIVILQRGEPLSTKCLPVSQ